MTNKYKINFHAHSHFSDGGNTMREMAIRCKELGFCSCVITDHHYGSSASYDSFKSSKGKIRIQKELAKEIEQTIEIPVIIGIEYNFAYQEEIACFGTGFIRAIIKEEPRTIEEFGRIKNDLGGAAILVHPVLSNGFLAHGGPTVIDGFEEFNAGNNFFTNRAIPQDLDGLPRYSNSDAHHVRMLGYGYNIINKPILNEDKLVSWIRKREKFTTYARCNDANTENL